MLLPIFTSLFAKLFLKPRIYITFFDSQYFILQKVEQASDFAAAQAFGKARAGKSTKSSILHTVDQLHDHDAAYEEGMIVPYAVRLYRNFSNLL